MALVLCSLYAIGCSASAQESNAMARGLSLHYVLRVDTTDLSGYDIELHINNAPHTLRLAMATHHEYDDKYWKHLEHFSIKTSTGKGSFVKEDSALWRISIPEHDAVISYRLHLPNQTSPQRACHRPFLTATGGLVGDLHSFMYMVGQTDIPCYVTFQMPGDWKIATGLKATSDPKVYSASSAKVLMDCPVLIGKLHTWGFTVSGIPHRVAYWAAQNALAFDTSLLVDNIKKISEQEVSLFGAIPYDNYTFLLQDNAFGALEHLNSVTLGTPSAMLASHMNYFCEEIAHEFSHTWNLMRIKPAEYTELNYGPQERASGLWFSEGLAMFYADLLVRRAGLETEDTTRTAHLEHIIKRYYADTGNTFIPTAKVSLTSNVLPGELGDYNASVHVQGELIGAMLDLIIRNATNNKRSIDDVMKAMFKRFGGDKGFYTKDIEGVVKEVCDCDVHPFFQAYVYNGHAINFNEYLKLAGMQMQLSWTVAKDDKGNVAPDFRIYKWTSPADSSSRIFITTPNGCWGRAGLHTTDILVAFNGKPVERSSSFGSLLRDVHIGDTVFIMVKRDDGTKTIPVVITSYMEPVVKIKPLDKVNEQQQSVFDSWIKGLN